MILFSKSIRHKRAVRRAAVIKGATTAWEVLKRVEKIVEKEETVVDMGTFFSTVKDRLDSFSSQSQRMWGKGSVCGSVGCLSGWGGKLLGVNGFTWGEGAPVAILLGLDTEQVRILFHPAELVGGSKSRDIVGPKVHQKLVLAHLREFMLANEAQLKAKVVPPLENRPGRE